MSKNSETEKFVYSFPFLNVTEINAAIETLENMKSMKIFVSDSFHEDVWSFSHEYSPGMSIRLDYGKIVAPITVKEIQLVKLWVISLLEKHRPSTAIYYFHYFSIALNESNNFSLEKLDEFIEWLHNESLSNNEKIYLLSNVLDYFEFCDHPNANIYIPRLYETRQKIRYKSNPIQLPSSKNILKFSYYTEKFFRDIDNNISLTKDEILHKKILFLPILIWWKLTTIIPIRSTEFCMIKRKSLSNINNRYFIEIQRIKRPLENKNHNSYNTIEINEEIYKLISEYIKLTDVFGHSETLISYRSLVSVDHRNRRLKQKINLDSFNKNNFEKLLSRFYKEVIRDLYEIEIPITQRLSANDTRHIAFISLMMQGIPPVEIARLGGHKTIAAQYHYSFHTEYWIDNEVFKLIRNYKNDVSITNQTHHLPDKIRLMAFKPSDSTYKASLPIGYCTDSLLRCEAKECMLCSHWRIDLEELETKQELILTRINQNKTKITELMIFIYNIQLQTKLHPYSSNYLKSEEQLQNILIKIESELVNLTKLNQASKGYFI